MVQGKNVHTRPTYTLVSEKEVGVIVPGGWAERVAVYRTEHNGKNYLRIRCERHTACKSPWQPTSGTRKWETEIKKGYTLRDTQVTSLAIHLIDCCIPENKVEQITTDLAHIKW